MVKKMFGIAAFALMMLGPGNAFAAAQPKNELQSVPVMMGAVRFEGGNAALSVPSQSAAASEDLMDKLASGQLSSEEQKILAELVQRQSGNAVYINRGVRMPMLGFGAGGNGFVVSSMMGGGLFYWMQIVKVITVILVWVVLLLAIALLWKNLKKSHF